ncbi:uncharacterized protein LOC110655973 [Hevea brasiliensis]|uniref:uncharacterized protein LOC110655973 n=1 Tax=Hevea brasiliensis TaxID=3981 RepID=UPI0025D3EB6C|nr:uncharacterized protein LOC110655973 [Hevea brasiliensis]
MDSTWEPRTSNIDSQNINVMIAESAQEVDNSTSNTYEQMVMDARVPISFRCNGGASKSITKNCMTCCKSLIKRCGSCESHSALGCCKDVEHQGVTSFVEDSELTNCKFCDHPRFKRHSRGASNFQTNVPHKKMYYFPLTQRLQRLYASNATAKEMRWHAEHDHEDGEEYMFLTVLVPGPRNPKDKLDVYLQPLIAELKQLWEVGVETYDASKKNNFNMRVALLWTISDFPAYSMLSDWSTTGETACPYCRDDSDAFTLTKGGKQSWFDNHRKFLPANHPFDFNKIAFRKNKTVTKSAPPILSGEEILEQIEHLGLMCVTDMGADENNSCKAKNTGWKRRSIFWDLPYWSTNMLRHNLDVMHIEKNVFENIFNTVMNVEGKTKDNAKSREDLKEFCHRPELERDMATGKYPKACYTLDKQSKAVLCEWLKNLRFPDGYVSNMGRCIDMRKLKLFGMKSHDCHVFMQRLLPIAFSELLPKNVWQALTELSNFFRELTSTTLREEAMLQLNEEIPIILCKLERIFPPSFFDSMEHLPVHLAYEAWIAGPVQYRWMYPFERYLRKLKNNVKNKAKVEGSICNAYLVEEASSFCAHYFEPHVNTRHRKVPRNDDTVEHMDEHLGNLSIFTHSGRPLEKERLHISRTRISSETNVHLVEFIFVNELHMANPNINDKQVDEKLEREFDKWFNKYVHNPSNNISSQF